MSSSVTVRVRPQMYWGWIGSRGQNVELAIFRHISTSSLLILAKILQNYASWMPWGPNQKLKYGGNPLFDLLILTSYSTPNTFGGLSPNFGYPLWLPIRLTSDETIFFKISELLEERCYFLCVRRIEVILRRFRENVGQSTNIHTPISPPNGGRSPKSSLFFHVPKGHNMQWSDGV